MISEKDKQAILNGAYAVTRGGRKVKYLGCNESSDHYPWKFIVFDKQNHIKNELLNLQFSQAHGFYASPVDDSPNDIVGLWQDKVEPFDLSKALKGNPVLLRGGSKAYIFHCINDEFAKNHNIGYQLLGVIVDSLEGKQFTRSWAKSGIFNEINPHSDFDIIGMWKEPEPQLLNNGLQLPKPLTELPNESTTLYCLSFASDGDAPYGKLTANTFTYYSSTTSALDEIYLKNGRLYRTKEEVIQVIEAITGKPYEEYEQ